MVNQKLFFFSSVVVNLATYLALYGQPLSAQSFDDEPEKIASHFECKSLGNGKYRPYYLKASADGSEYLDYSKVPKGLLGQNPMGSIAECTSAIESSNQKAGVICSRTGLDGWKPTIFTGTTPGRKDFGYLGGSSIVNLKDCLNSTKYSSEKGVCYWGGSDWYVAPINKEGFLRGPFRSLEQCIATTKE
ncbi:MAG: hypothetical protein NTV34_20210 [Proteobacteria bacterium]|nr:hypothetical protein [Pseudomonadota bacterium]